MKILLITALVIAGLLTVASGDGGTTPSTATIKPTNKIEVCTGVADVVLVLDRSGSVGDKDYEFLIGFARHLARTFGISKENVRLGVASYADTATREINLDTYGYDNFVKKTEAMVRGTEELTNIHAGLLMAEEMLEDKSRGARDGAVKLIVVTNDGAANRGEDPVATAKRLHKKFTIVSIGIEIEVEPPFNKEVKGLASRSDLYYHVDRYAGLADQSFLTKITKALCRIVTVFEPTVGDTMKAIYENTPIDTNIHKIPSLVDKFNKPQYQLIQQQNLPFRVDVEGNIYVTGLLDRETTPKYVFFVYVTDLNLPDFKKKIKVTIIILDVNDNKPIPVDNKLEYTVEVWEDVAYNPPTTIFTVSATDADEGINAKLSYHLTGGNSDDKFQLVPHSGALQVKSQLDRETTPTYKLTAIAKDLGTPSLQSVPITINVIVKDRNDNTPTFEDAVIHLEYPENQALGNLHQLVASDLDIGLNGKIVYKFHSSNGGNDDNKFSLDENTGYISLINAFDFEVKSLYTLKIIAEDMGTPSLSSTVTVHIKVTNIDEPLTIDGPHSKSIPEDFGTVKVVLQVIAADPENAPIQYSIIEESPFTINSNGNIRVVGAIDREADIYVYELTIKATAGGHSVTTKVSITITDVNDNTPKFGQNTYKGFIDENAEKHTPVQPEQGENPVSATDNDATSPNNLFEFSISAGNTDDAFKIDSASGIVSVNNPSALDFESSVTVYQLTLTVTDKGNPTLSSTALCIITIKNVNDHTPEFPNNNADIHLEYPENQPLGNLYKLVAEDADRGLFGELEYSIVSGNDENVFELEKTSGYLRLIIAFNYEVKNSYTLIVKAQDKGTPSKSAQVTVYIKVTNIDEKLTINGPFDESIPENLDKSQVIVKVTAVDPENGQITYSIMETSPFTINENGEITLSGDVDRESGIYKYTLTIKASAGQHTVSTTVTITVTDVNDETPTFTAAEYTGSVSETANENVPITVDKPINAKDDDATHPNNAFMFSIMSGNDNGAFKINSVNGVISVADSAAIDFESSTKQYVLNIKVTDKGTPSLYSTSKVTISVKDENDNPPKFPDSEITVQFREDQAIGNLFQLAATDLDSGANGMIEYFLDTNDDNKFSIVKENGYIILLSAFDFEVKSSFTIVVKATDKGVPSQSTTITVRIIVLNVDEKLVIDGPFDELIPEDHDKTKVIVKVTAVDPENGQITYSIMETSPFTINENGEITLTGDVDRESDIYKYTLTIKASAGQHTVSTTVTITVTDVNDETPSFSRKIYLGNVNEHADKDSLVTTATAIAATDGDATSPNNQFMFEIKSGNNNDAFKIDMSTGVVSVNKPSELDYESDTKSYTLIIKVTDKGTPSLHSTATFNIDINNINDNEPQVNPVPSPVEIYENAAINHNVIKITANDADGDQLSFSIPAGLPFSINNQGQIFVSGKLDAETQQMYTVTISITDGKHTTTVSVKVTILDVNDVVPAFELGSTTFTVREDKDVGYLIDTIKASDGDLTAPNNLFMLSIDSGNDDNTFLLEQNGKLTLAKKLSFNDRKSYKLILKVQDKGTNPGSLHSTIEITINVLDANIHAPIFVDEPYDVSIDENKEHPFVIKVSANDADLPNDELTYSIENDGPFEIDEKTGAITGKGTFDSESQHTYVINIKVTDKAGQYDSSSVSVTIADLNDEKPEFISGSSKIENVPENKAVGSILETYVAKDNDRTSPNNKVMYMIVGDGNIGDAFEIDQNTGELKVKNALDFETLKSYTITIRAQDKGTPSMFTDRLVMITIKGVPEHPPTFEPQSYEESVEEDKNDGYTVLTVKATDADDGSILTYSIPTGIPFAISNTGVITLKSLNPPNLPLDFEKQQQYIFDVTVSDESGATATATVTINVLDVNDNTPIFDPHSYMRYIREDESVGTLVVTVVATDKDSTSNGMIVYEITEGNDQANFEIDSVKGDIKISKLLDFETEKSYTLTVKASDKGNPSKFSTVQVQIIVTDVNEKPVFSVLTKEVTVTEDSKTGTTVDVASATDPDTGDNGKLMYTIVSGNDDNIFELDMTTGKVTLKKEVNFEDKNSYVLVIRATDKGIPALSTESKDYTLTVNIGDVNEKPYFDPDRVELNIPETTETSTVVTKAKAHDPDNGPAGMVMYEILTGNEDGDFAIDATTGNISVNKALNVNKKSKYTLIVRATDKGEKPQHSGPKDLKVIITLSDENNHAPIFDPEHYTQTISESSDIGDEVTQVFATDKDVGSNGQIKYSIVSGDDGTFTIHEETGAITVAKNVDYETTSTYTLTIRATDMGNPPRHSEKDATVKIFISNTNEHAPKITNLPETKSFKETNETFDVFTVTATDKDGDQIVFSLETDGPFTIDSSTGKIVTNAGLDRETRDMYSIKVTASDSKLTDMKVLTVKVLDMNDNAPIFVEKTYTETIPENVDINTDVVTVQATDKDAGVNKDLMYMIVEGNDEGKFKIGLLRGTIQVADYLDFEKTSEYTLKVRATDKGESALSSAMDATVKIFVTDVNDNKPIFKPVDPIDLLENTEFPKVIVKVTANDEDSGDNGRVMYSIIKGNTDKFSINMETGEISVIGKLNFEETQSYKLTIRATDKGTPPQDSSPDDLIVMINVIDVNDNAPQFTQKEYTKVIPETTTPGTVVLTVQASDEDSGDNGKFMFLIKSGDDGKFAVDMNSGEISLASALDIKKQGLFVFTVLATDKGTPSKTTEALVRIQITDSNMPPVFDPVKYTTTVSENTDVGETVSVVSASDEDTGSNGEFMYEIIEGNDEHKFEIEMTTGVITLKNKLDFEKTTSYVLTVRATDKGEPSMHTNPDAMVTITVTDANDNAPIFTKSSYEKVIPETTKSGTVIETISANDEDSGSNAEIMYEITTPGVVTFAIDMTTGELSVEGPLDAAKRDEYKFTVRATDKGDPAKSADVEVTIKISDVNMKPSLISDGPFDILDNEKENKVIFQVKATDPDLGDNGKLMFSIIGGNDDGFFEIDMNSGEVTVAKDLATGKPQTITLDIQVADKGDPSLTDSKKYVINITPANHPPTITPQGPVKIREDAMKGSVVITIIASDSDDGDNGKIMYEIVDGNIGDAFEIDMHTGKITVSGSLDASVTSMYDLKIKVTDKGKPPLSATGSLKVMVTAVTSPIFTNGPYSTCIDENNQPGVTLFTAAATDEDGDQLTFFIPSEYASWPFSIDSNGVVKVLISLDAERFREPIKFKIGVTDGKHNVTADVTLCVNDLKDNAPAVKVPNNADICENAEIGSKVWQIEVMLLDLVNVTLTYNILSSQAIPFSINQQGSITVSGAVDFEQQSYYEFKVQVSDGDLKTTVDVKVTVCDLNEYKPVFDPETYQITIPDGAGKSFPVANVRATDKDSGTNGMIVYAIVSGNDDEFFEIDSTTGAIKLRKVVDASKEDEYKLIVSATDKGTKPSSMVSSPNAIVNVKIMKKDICECVLPQKSYPCIKWTKYEIIRKFEGKCYLDKLKDAITHIESKIKMVAGLISQFNNCKGNLRSELTSSSPAISYAQLFKRYDACLTNVECKLTLWKMQLEQKLMQLKKEKVIEEEGWGTFNIPASDYMNSLLTYIGSKSSRKQDW